MDFPFVKEALANLFSKSSCEMYPVVPSGAADRYRGKIVFRPELCVNCGMCERVCAGGAITTVIEKTEEGDRVTRTFNLGSCTFCSNCADFCHNGAISLSRDYHMIATKPEDLLVTGTFIKKKPAPKAAPAAAPATQATDSAAPAPVQPREDGKPVSDPSKCVYCGLCARNCPMEAIEVDRTSKTWKLDADKCIACGTCAANCPKNCIIM